MQALKKLYRPLYNSSFILLLFLFIGLNAKAGIEPEIKKYLVGDSFASNNSEVIIFDNLSYIENGNTTGTYSGLGYQEYQIKNRVFLELNEFIDSCFVDPFTLSVQVQIESRDINNTLRIDTVNLTINYDTLLLKKNAEISSYVFDGGLWCKITILGVTNADYQKFIKVGQTLNIERYRDLSSSPIQMDYHPFIDSTRLIKFTWLPVEGAEEYDLEWIWIDGYDPNSSNIINPANISVDFRHNATRVTLTSTSYSISEAYELGYVVARVRPVGRNKNKINQVVNGVWSNDVHGSSPLSAYNVAKDYTATSSSTSAFMALSSEMNWQFVATFAEDGKRKEVVSYYDGSLRNRQSVTRISTGMHAVVGETIYDYEGRPSVNILPVPTFDNKLGFHGAFNISQATNKTYDKSDFDATPTEICNVSIAILKNSAGASKYYSDQNPNISKRADGHIPDAEGYPMTVTEYMPDGTGRIKRQSGVGSTHKLGSGHETKYYYATPSAQELFRLFGNAVGDSIHYQKEMVIDPNGQASVSYKDLSGKVIATALAGNSPDSLKSLASGDTAETALNATYPSTYFPKSNDIVMSKEIVVPGNSTRYDFSYAMEVPRISFDSFPDMCFDCVYELVISVTDDCGNEILDGNPSLTGNQPIVRTIGKLGVDFDTICESNKLRYAFHLDDQLSNDTSLTVYLNTGKYTVFKSLRISDVAYAYYYDRFITSAGVKTLDSFQNEMLLKVDTLNCNLTCEQCETNLGTFTNYLTQRYSSLLAAGADSTDAYTIAQSEFTTMQNECIALCEDTSGSCTDFYLTCFYDMSLGGQYLVYEKDPISGVLLSTGGFLDTSKSTFLNANFKEVYENGSWIPLPYLNSEGNPITVEIDGISYSPNELSAIQYINYFNDSWLPSIVKYHPEYCRYLSCSTNTGLQASYEYTQAMLTIDNFKVAYALGYVDPLGQYSTIPSNNDSYFNSGHTSFKTNYVAEYAPFKFANMTGAVCDNISILDYSLLTYYSDWTFSDCSEAEAWLKNFDWTDTANLCDDRLDAVWEMFKAVYVSQKQKYFEATQVVCTPTIPSPYTRRFTPIADIAGEVDVNTGESNQEVHKDSANSRVLSSCDDVCDGQAIYWLEKLGGCNLDSITKSNLIDTFKVICKNGCDPEHPWGAFDYPTNIAQRYGTQFYSFEEAFNTLVPIQYRSSSVCNVWTISSPKGYSSTFKKMQGVDDSCGVRSDTCYSTASTAFKDYSKLNASGTLGILGESPCEDCINCADYVTAKDSLISKYSFLLDSSTQETQLILTNYMNHQFGFNLTYWDYIDFEGECSQCDSFTIDSSLFNLVTETLDSVILDSGFYNRFEYIEGLNCTNSVTKVPTEQDKIDANNQFNYLQQIKLHFVTLSGMVDQFERSIVFDTLVEQDTFAMPVNLNNCAIGTARNNWITYIIDSYGDTTNWICNRSYDVARTFCKQNFNRQVFRKINSTYVPVAGSYNSANHNFELSPGDSIFVYDSLLSIYRKVADLYLMANRQHVIVRNKNYSSYELHTFLDANASVGRQNDKYQILISQNNSCVNLELNVRNFIKDIVSFISYSLVDDNTYKVVAEVRNLVDGIDTIELDMNIILGECMDIDTCSRTKDTTLCNRPYGTIDYVVPPPCITWKKMRAYTLAEVAYQSYKDSLKRAFKDNYYLTCMGVKDTFDVNYQLKEYHYTLYYYDQAGNLIQTVPPAGVDIITSQSTLAAMAQAHKGNGSAIYPNHELVTRYKYNSLNEVRWQKTPDGGISQFWYDRLGRMAVSQNAQQANQSPLDYSYTLYDSLGRISEVGQLSQLSAMSKTLAFDTATLRTWLEAGSKEQITRTWYDYALFEENGLSFLQENLRGRVSSMAYYEQGIGTYEHAVHYTYDIHGNVKQLDRENTKLAYIMHAHKTITYDYDLVSGNVNYVYYQKNKDDQYSHRYLYDADNRLTNVFTSSDLVHWDEEAAYYYYLHGPLRRVELGGLKVQGMDYAYTLHGWLKGVNSNNLHQQRDIGQDGHSSGINTNVARDVFGYSLHYYNDDYKPINKWNTTDKANYFLMEEPTTAGFNNQVRQLYNGNISRMVTALDKLTNTVIGKAYQYDQLNRISQSYTFTNYSITTNKWLTGSASADFYSNYSYDANGNLLTLNRNAGYGVAMDNLTYHYITGTNQLDYVDDNVSAALFSNDIDDESSNNYTYDKIGNLVSDVSEEIINIDWTVYGKIKSITRKGTAVPGKTDKKVTYTSTNDVTIDPLSGEISGNTIGWQSSAISNEVIDGNGYLEWTILGDPANNQSIVVGLAYANGDVNNIDYKLTLNASNNVTIENKTTQLLNLGSTVQTGDVMKIERKGNLIFWYRNGGSPVAQMTQTGTGPLLVDVHIYKALAAVEKLRITTSIADTTNGISSKPNLEFEYSPDGHRVAKHVLDSGGAKHSTYYVRDASGNIMATYSGKSEDPESITDVNYADVYFYVDSTKSFADKLLFLENGVDWEPSLTSTFVDSLELAIIAENKEVELLKQFPSIQIFSDPAHFDEIYYNNLTIEELIEALRSSGKLDEIIVQTLCANGCADSLLTAMMNYNYSYFLQLLHDLSPAIFDQIVSSLLINPSAPLPQKINEIILNSSIANTISLMNQFGFDCSLNEQILDQLATLNSAQALSILSNVGNLKTCVRNSYGDYTVLALELSDYLGNNEIWDRILATSFLTTADYLNMIRNLYPEGFVTKSLTVLQDDDLLIQGVLGMPDQKLEHWLSYVQSFFGQAYYDQMISALYGSQGVPTWAYRIGEHHIYGSSRLGLRESSLLLATTTSIGGLYQYKYQEAMPNNADSVQYIRNIADSSILTFYRGQKRYELSNHLGNVLAVITDRRIQACGAGDVMYYNAQVVSVSDYYPFGMGIKEREWKDSSFGYRFGFNGQEQDNEVSGEGNSYTAEFWQYDSRLGRRWNTDPIVKPFESPYACFRNYPILLIDPTGEDVDLGKLSKEDRAEVENKVNSEHKDYNEAYAGLYQKLVDDKNTMYTFNNTHVNVGPSGGKEMGNVSYGGKNDDGQDIISINYTTDLYNSMSDESALFEETFHADQFRRGEFGFSEIDDGTWGTFGLDIYDEVDAKIWAHSNVNNGNPLGQNKREYKKISKNGTDREAYAKYLQTSDTYIKVYSGFHSTSENIVESIMRVNGSQYSLEKIESWFDAAGVLRSNNKVGRLPESNKK